MKILYVIESLNNGGAEILAFMLASHLKQKGFEAVVCSLSDEGPLRERAKQQGIRVYSLGKKDGKDWSLIKKIRDLIKIESIDLVHTHNQGPLLYVALSLRTLQKRNRPIFIHTEHINMDTELSYRLRDKIIHRLLFSSIDGMVSIADHLSTYFTDVMGLDRNKICTIRNGIDMSFNSKLDVKLNLRGELGLAADTRIVGTISALRKQKDLETLLRAAAIVRSGNSKVKFVLAGEGDQFDYLRNICRDLDLESTVFFLGYRSDVLALLSNFEVFVLPSLYEGLPLCLLEAMAAGVPIIATDTMGNNELVKDEHNGLLVPVKNADKLATAVLRMLADHDLREDLAERGLNDLRAKFDFKKNVAKYISYYNSFT